MNKPKLLRHIAVYGISLPTFAVSPAYMPSLIAARKLGGRAPRTSDVKADDGIAQAAPGASASHAA
ncbi:hypothetical protein BH11GEM2_BH11GEM2_09530 [soil metagenome]